MHFVTLTEQRGHCRSKYHLFAFIGHSRLVLIAVSPSRALPCLPTLLTFPHTPLTFIPLSSSVQVLLSPGEELLLQTPRALCVCLSLSTPSSCVGVTYLLAFLWWTESSLG